MDSFTGNVFVDLLVEVAPGKTRRLRYHVMQDKDEKWYFEPRPDLCPLFFRRIEQGIGIQGGALPNRMIGCRSRF
ncbi:MAG: hypothetical protein WDN28_32695 [Chthoniobacter sp.]